MKEKAVFRDVYEILSSRYPSILTKEQVAEIVGCSVSTAKRKFKGEVKLAELIKEYLV